MDRVPRDPEGRAHRAPDPLDRLLDPARLAPLGPYAVRGLPRIDREDLESTVVVSDSNAVPFDRT
jgi:hypothetical protein